MTQALENLFGSATKVKLLRLFLQNTGSFFTFEESIKRSNTPRHAARRELAGLLKGGVIEDKIVSVKEELKRSKSKKRKFKIKRVRVYFANPTFWFLNELRNLVTKAPADAKKKLIPRIKRLGNVKLAIVSGIFLNNENTRTDLLVVGDKIKRSRLDHILAGIESEIGKPLRYTFMETSEFKYRLDMYDRFLRDILEFPHEKLINKMHI